MTSKKKYYVVWSGLKTGVFDTWAECEAQVKGQNGARFKSYPTLSEAEEAFRNGLEATSVRPKPVIPANAPQPISQAIAVDAACAGNPGRMEYRGVFVATGQEIFHSRVYEGGTNNIGEFLAIVHCLAYQQKNNLHYPIYSDSVNGMGWVSAGCCRTKLKQTDENAELFDVIRRAEQWLKTNSFRLPVYKWRTEIWGEVPADFGRK